MRLAVPVIAVCMCRVRMSVIVDLDSFVVAPESHEQQTEHVKGRDEGRDRANHPVRRVGLEGLPEDLILATKACQWRNSCNRGGGNQHHRERCWNVGLEATHLPHVLFTANGVNDGTGAEEEQSFEEGMRH